MLHTPRVTAAEIVNRVNCVTSKTFNPSLHILLSINKYTDSYLRRNYLAPIKTT